MYKTKEELILKFLDVNPVLLMKGVEGWAVAEHGELAYLLNGERYSLERVWVRAEREGYVFFSARENGHDEYLIFDLRDKVGWDELDEMEKEVDY